MVSLGCRAFDELMPVDLRLGEFFDSVEVTSDELGVGVEVWLCGLECGWRVYPVVGFGPSPVPKIEEARQKMERHPKRLHVRIFDCEQESTMGLTYELGMTVSDPVRVFLQPSAEEAHK